MKLFQRAQRSLFGEILDWMLTPLLLLVPVSIGVTWLVAQGIANAPFDRALQHNVQALAKLVHRAAGPAQFVLPQPAREILRGRRRRPRLLPGAGRPRRTAQRRTRRAAAPRPTSRRRSGTVYLRDGEMRGKPVRVASLGSRATAADAPPALLQMAETREKQSVLATEIIKGVLLPQFAILPLAVLLIWLALVRGIKPLSVVEARIRERKPGDLSPLDESSVPLEVVPLVSSVNDLLSKLNDSIGTQKRFLADAAHQLKTPLAGLRMQADLAQREGANARSSSSRSSRSAAPACAPRTP